MSGIHAFKFLVLVMSEVGYTMIIASADYKPHIKKITKSIIIFPQQTLGPIRKCVYSDRFSVLGSPDIVSDYIWDENVPSSVVVCRCVLDRLAVTVASMRSGRVEGSARGRLRGDVISLRTLTWMDTLLYTHLQVSSFWLKPVRNQLL